MARSDTWTLIPLDYWAQVYGLDLYRFNQVNHAPAEDCNPLWCQRAPGIGPSGRYHLRDVLAEALAEAEAGIERELGSPVAPDWIMDELPWNDPGLMLTNRYRVIQFGRPVWRQLGDYGDYAVGYNNDTGTVIVPAADVAGVDLCNLWLIAPGYPGPDVRRTYAIRPVRWHVDAAGNYVARAHQAQFVDPVLWEVCEPLVDEAATYLDTVEVWEVKAGVGTAYAPAEILYTAGGSCSEAMCAETTELSCAMVQGLFDRYGGKARAYIWPADYAAGVWTPKSHPTGYCPVRVHLYYQAGVRPQRPQWCESYEERVARAVARLATALLPHAPCGCEAVAEMFAEDRRWMASSGNPMSTPSDPHAYLNPFGNTWAAQNALKVVRSIRPNRRIEGGKA